MARTGRKGLNRRFDRRTALKIGAGAAGAAALGGRGWSVMAQEATPEAGFDLSGMEISGDVEIEYWQYEFESKTTLVGELIPQFQEQNPGITVKHVNFPYDDFQQQVAAAVQAGEGPDVLNVYYGWIPAYVQQQFLQPLSQEAFPHDVIESEYFAMVTTAKVGGEYYALPTAVRTLALFVNNDILAEAGVAPPTTWDETVEVAKATTRKNGDNFEVVGMTWDIGGQGHHWWRECLVRQNGIAPYSEDNRQVQWDEPEGVEAFRWLVAFLMEHDVTQSGFMTDGQTAFGNGAAALHVDGSFRVGSYATDFPNLNYSIVPLPEKEQKASFASFWANAITRNAAEGDKNIAAHKFINFLSSPEIMRQWTPATGELPARPALAEEEQFTSDEKLAPFIESLPFSYATFLVNEAELRQNVMDAFDQVTLNGVDAEVAVQEAAAKTQERLDEYWAAIDAG
jgi:multiple sugar transport system substrate-binding protein